MYEPMYFEAPTYVINRTIELEMHRVKEEQG